MPSMLIYLCCFCVKVLFPFPITSGSNSTEGSHINLELPPEQSNFSPHVNLEPPEIVLMQAMQLLQISTYPNDELDWANEDEVES